jgi:hypothetical protein
MTGEPAGTPNVGASDFVVVGAELGASDERLDTTPGEILAAVPEEIKEGVRGELGNLTEWLGECWIGGSWDPRDDAFRDARVHTDASLTEAVAKAEGLKALRSRLRAWSAEPKPKRVLLLLFLWLECWQLWDAYLIYRTLPVIATTIDEVTAAGDMHPRPGPGDADGDWETAAWQAAGDAISLITADADIFRQVVLSDPAGLSREAQRGIAATAKTIDAISALVVHGGLGTEDWQLAAKGLRYVAQIAADNKFFYEFLAAAASALGTFHGWLASASAQHAGRVGAPATGSAAQAAPTRQTVLDGVDAALRLFRSPPRKLSAIIESRIEPWEQLLTEMRDILLPADGQEHATAVFIPRRVSVRYCYPFAVETPARAVDTDEHTWLETRLRLLAPIKDDLDEQLKTRLGIEVRDIRPLDPTALFTASSADTGLYGGIQIALPDIVLSTGQRGEEPSRCRVWIVLSRMGNHCLCIERDTLEAPLPPALYRAVAAGTPFVFGVTAVCAANPDAPDATGPDEAGSAEAGDVGQAKPGGEPATWDNLHSFGRDVIRAVANAGFWRPEPLVVAPASGNPGDANLDGNVAGNGSAGNDNYVRGNLHEVIITRTDGPLGKDLDAIAARLNSALGGRILLRSIQRAPTTADEWLRYPPARQQGAADAPEITGLPELGLAGDWCAHTGEATVFGVVATPSWFSEAYAEAAQFASSWSPLLRLWHRRMQKAIDSASRSGETEASAKELRRVEQTVRRHLAQVGSEELCATLAYRRFLDRLLEMAGVPRLQRELESLLDATERLMDWWSEDARRETEKLRRESEDARRENEAEQRKADGRRDKLLGVIALFGMFDLAGFLDLGNATHWQQSVFGLFTVSEGVWEDWLLGTLFLIALALALRLGLFGGSPRLRPGWLRRLPRLARGLLPGGHAPDKDVGKGLGDVLDREMAAGPEPQVGVVVHAEPGDDRQPGVGRAEVA